MAEIESLQVVLNNKKVCTIRTAMPSDAKSVIQYVKKILKETDFNTTDPDEFPSEIAKEKKFLRESMKAPADYAILAEVDGKVVSFLDFNAHKRRRLAHSGEFGISVLKKFWGVGVASAMLKVLIANARHNLQLRMITLKTHANNKRAIALYQKHGFRKAGLIPSEVKRRSKKGYDDTLIMILELT